MFVRSIGKKLVGCNNTKQIINELTTEYSTENANRFLHKNNSKVGSIVLTFLAQWHILTKQCKINDNLSSKNAFGIVGMCANLFGKL